MKTNTLLSKLNNVFKILAKDDAFSWNLLSAIFLTSMLFLFKSDIISTFFCCLLILNWCIVISLIIKAFRH